MVDNATLLEVETELRHQFSRMTGPMAEVCRYTIAGGHRVRASLLLGAAQATERRIIQAATAVEMLHAATLLQDDVFDAGCVRHGRVTAHLKFGKALAVLASDCLLIRSLELATEVHPCFFRALSQAGRAMAEAEASELAPPKMESLSVATHFAITIAKGKTAALFASVLCGAAAFRTADVAYRHHWEQLGMEMGLTYQLVDDYVDIYGNQTASGKTVQTDMSAGRLTIPVLLGIAALREQHIVISPETLRSRRLTTEQAFALHAALASPHVRKQLLKLVKRRLAAHHKLALQIGVGSLEIDGWSTDLEVKLMNCSPQLAWSPPQKEAGVSPILSTSSERALYSPSTLPSTGRPSGLQ